MSRKPVVISGAFDDMRFEDFRFIEEASKQAAMSDAPLHANLWTDDAVESVTGRRPKFPLAERQYVLGSVRWIDRVVVTGDVTGDAAAKADLTPEAFSADLLRQAPPAPIAPIDPPSARKKVVVTGCFDWFHSGHVRFFEECAEIGDLYVVVGHDRNIRLLKGEGHPLFPAAQRRYIASAIRFVTCALISSGDGWMDAEPEFTKIRPDIYAVNEDGDKPEKRAFCDRHAIEYRVLKRLPRQGLPRRQSTTLRGF